MDDLADRIEDLDPADKVERMKIANEVRALEQKYKKSKHDGFVLGVHFNKLEQRVKELEAKVRELEDALTKIKYASHTRMAVGIAEEALNKASGEEQ